MSFRARLLVGFGACLISLVGCDRNTEPFDPTEAPREPDLSKIFPAGAERAAAKAAPPGIPDAPSQQGGRGMDPSADAPPIRGVVQLAPRLAGQLPSGAVLFLIARAGGAGPPLAVVRVADPSFPLDFEIGPRDRMIPSIPFAGELQITARLDQDGDAASRTSGDLHGGAKGAHAPGATGVSVVLDEAL